MFTPKDKSFDKDSLQTPRYIFDWLDSIYNFDLDLCASDNHHFCDRYFTKDNPARAEAWKTAFCNPPYSNIDPFLDIAIQSRDKFKSTTVFLIPELNGEKRTELLMKEAARIIHLSPRISFIRPDNGEEYKGNNRGSIVVEFSPKCFNEPAIHSFQCLKDIKNNFTNR